MRIREGTYSIITTSTVVSLLPAIMCMACKGTLELALDRTPELIFYFDISVRRSKDGQNARTSVGQCVELVGLPSL